ncbi:MAG TPA: heliorhodopsin HeR [Streptosporangiaceae bacterium]
MSAVNGRRTELTAVEPLSAATRRRLRIVNVSVGVVLGAEGVLMLVLSSSLSLPVTASFLRNDPVAVQGPAPGQVLFRLAIGPAVAVFLLLAMADHLLVASPGLHRWYEAALERRANYARWIEYSVSASLMIVLICMFVGIRDIAALLGLFAANTAMILFGLLMERQQTAGAADWSAYWFGCLAGAVPWVAIFWYVAGAPRVPGFVWAITVTQLALFTAFAVNMALQYLRVGPWRSYLTGERVYLTLSLVAKSLLAWLIYANVLRT